MHSDELGRPAENFLMDGAGLADDVAGGFGLPAGVVAGLFHRKPGQFEYRGDHAGGGALAALNRAALAGRDLDFATLGIDNGQVGGRLHQTGDVGAHGQNAVMLAGKHVRDQNGVGIGDDLLRTRGGFNLDAKAGIEGAEVHLHLDRVSRQQGLQLRHKSGIEHHDGERFARNGVAFASALDFGDRQWQAIHHGQ